MRAINKAKHASRATLGCDLLHREDERRRARDVIDDYEPSLRVDAPQHRLDYLRGIHEWQRQIGNHALRSPAFAHPLHRLPYGVVAVVGDENPIPSAPLDAVENGSDARRCVRDEPDALRCTAEGAADRFPDLPQQAMDCPSNHLDRSRLEPIAPARGLRFDRTRHRSK